MELKMLQDGTHVWAKQFSRQHRWVALVPSSVEAPAIEHGFYAHPADLSPQAPETCFGKIS